MSTISYQISEKITAILWFNVSKRMNGYQKSAEIALMMFWIPVYWLCKKMLQNDNKTTKNRFGGVKLVLTCVFLYWKWFQPNLLNFMEVMQQNLKWKWKKWKWKKSQFIVKMATLIHLSEWNYKFQNKTINFNFTIIITITYIYQ